jgi:hypothetical protein
MNLLVHWFPLLPTGLVSALCAALVATLAFGSWLLGRKNVPRPWVLVLGALRAAAVAVFTLALLRPMVSCDRTLTLLPHALVLVDVSRSMAQGSAASDGSRLDEVRGALRDSRAIHAAAADHTLDWFAFDVRAYPSNSTEIDQTEPRGETTDLATSLTSALHHLQLANVKSGNQDSARRVLLASDGQDRGASDAIAAARELGVVVDVFIPAVSGATRQPAATIVDVQCAPRVLLGAETAFLVAVRADAAADAMTLVLETDDREVRRVEVGALAAGEETHVALSDRPAEPGLKRYTLRLSRGGDTIGKPQSVNVQVADQRYDVLLLEDTWRWEFKFLRRLLEDDPAFSFTAFLARGGAAFVQFGEPERRVQLGGFPHGRGELDGFDAIILGNVNPRNWPRGLARHIHEAVTGSGKSLVVMAGPHLAEWTDVVELTGLLPVELTAESGLPVAGPIELRITPEGEQTGWFALLSDDAGTAESTSAAAHAAQRLPPFDRVYPVLRKRPAARVHLEAVGHMNAFGPLVVMAEHTVGRGRVFFIGADTLWRWQMSGRSNESGVTLYSAFWQQVLRALAPVEPTSNGDRLWLRPERTSYRAGDRARLTAQWQHEGSINSAAVTATVVMPDGNRLPLEVVADQREPSRLAAQFDVVQPGRYRVEAAARGDAQLLAEISTIIEAAPRPREDDPSPVDAAFLARLASATGGRVIDPTSADGWLPPVEGPPTTVQRRQSFDLWHNSALLLVLCTLLAADWSLRLFRGYV